MEEANKSFGFGDFDDISATKSPTPDDSFDNDDAKIMESFSSPVAFNDSFTNMGTNKPIRKKKEGSKKKKNGEKELSPRHTSSPSNRKLMTMQPRAKQKSSGKLTTDRSTSPSSRQKLSKQKWSTKLSQKSKQQQPQSTFAAGDDTDWFFPDPNKSATFETSTNSSPLRGSNGKSKKSSSNGASSPTRTSSRKYQSRRSSMVGRVGSTDNSSMELAEVAKAEYKKSRRRSYAGKEEKEKEKSKSRSKTKSSTKIHTANDIISKKTVSPPSSPTLKQRRPPRELFAILDIEPWSSDNTTYSDEELMDAIEADPESVKKKYRFEFFGVVIYPFSMMCAIGSSLEAIQMCYEVFPEALQEKDPWVGSPLHYACGYEGPFEVVEWLIEQESNMLTTVNRLKRSPFHIACQFNPRSEILEALLHTAPMGLEIADKYGCTPLHLACENNAPIEVLEMMTDKFSMACIATSQAGASPLHLALENRVNLPKIKILIKAQESVLTIRDVEGRTPLHMAIENECDVKIIRFLVKSCPASLDYKTEWQSETPMEMAKRLNANHEVLDALIE